MSGRGEGAARRDRRPVVPWRERRYDAHHRTRVIRRLRQRAANLGFALVDRQTGELPEGAVS